VLVRHVPLPDTEPATAKPLASANASLHAPLVTGGQRAPHRTTTTSMLRSTAARIATAAIQQAATADPSDRLQLSPITVDRTHRSTEGIDVDLDYITLDSNSYHVLHDDEPRALLEFDDHRRVAEPALTVGSRGLA